MKKFCINCGYDLSSIVSTQKPTNAEVSETPNIKDNDIENEIESRIIRKTIIKKKATPQQSEHLAKARAKRQENIKKKKEAALQEKESSIPEEIETPNLKPTPQEQPK